MRQALISLLMIPLAVGCISARTTFRDSSDLSGSQFTYLVKDASYTQRNNKLLCLFQSNPFLGARPLYQQLHKKYDLRNNEAFINQRFDVVSKFWLIACRQEYTLSADIVRFQHSASLQGTDSRRRPKLQSKVTQVKATKPLNISCGGQNNVGGQPEPASGETTVFLELSEPAACEIKMKGQTPINTVLAPGKSYLCYPNTDSIRCTDVKPAR